MKLFIKNGAQLKFSNKILAIKFCKYYYVFVALSTAQLYSNFVSFGFGLKITSSMQNLCSYRLLSERANIFCVPQWLKLSYIMVLLQLVCLLTSLILNWIKHTALTLHLALSRSSVSHCAGFHIMFQSCIEKNNWLEFSNNITPIKCRIKTKIMWESYFCIFRRLKNNIKCFYTSNTMLRFNLK